MTLEISLSLGQGWVKNFKSERNKLKACHCHGGDEQSVRHAQMKTMNIQYNVLSRN